MIKKNKLHNHKVIKNYNHIEVKTVILLIAIKWSNAFNIF